jgi:hypothetical protein
VYVLTLARKLDAVHRNTVASRQARPRVLLAMPTPGRLRSFRRGGGGRFSEAALRRLGWEDALSDEADISSMAITDDELEGRRLLLEADMVISAGSGAMSSGSIGSMGAMVTRVGERECLGVSRELDPRFRALLVSFPSLPSPYGDQGA